MAIIGSPPTVFKKVGISERKTIIRNLSSGRGQLFIKSENIMYFFVANESAEDKILWLDYTEQSKGSRIGREALVNFGLGEDRYFMVTEFIVDKKRIGIKSDQDLFILQRRSTTRVEIPAAYPSTFNILNVNDRPSFIEMKVQDLSSGGMKLVETRDVVPLKMMDVIKGTLKIGARSTVNLDAEVRYVGEMIIKEKAHVILGIEFINVDKMLEGRLMTLVKQLQQELSIKPLK